MPELLLGPMLRYVSDTEATIWVETDARCEVGVLDATEPTFEVDGHHYALVWLESLEPGSTTPYTVELDGEERWPLPDSELPARLIRTLGGGPLGGDLETIEAGRICALSRSGASPSPSGWSRSRSRDWP